jgi:hypothetical protein
MVGSSQVKPGHDETFSNAAFLGIRFALTWPDFALNPM